MNFGKLLSRSVNVFSQKGISTNSTASEITSDMSKNYHHINILVVTFLSVIFSFEQSSFAQNYKHIEGPITLTAATINNPPETEQPSEEVKAEVVTRPRFVHPRVTEVEPKVAETSTDDKFYFPIKGLISSSYGENRRTHRHKGIDIAAAPGTPIYPAAIGRVVFAGWQSGYGNTLIIEHSNGSFSRYAHAQRLMVSIGDVVKISDKIATVGSTGRSTGPHLHFEITDGQGNQLNPLRVLYKRDFSVSEPSEDALNESLASNIELEVED